MEKEVDNAMFAYWNIMRGSVKNDDFVTASVLINEVKKRNDKMKTMPNSEQAYAALLEAADELNIQNPFTDKEWFFLIYQESRKLSSVDWEGAIAQAAAFNKIPVLSSAVIDVYRKRFSKKTETVLIAEAERFVPYLKKMVDENINSEFVLTTQNKSYAKALEYVFDDYENVKVLLTDIYRYGFIDTRFDLIFSCPTLGGRTLSEEETFICREFDMIALENLALHLNSGGRLVIILPGRITFAAGKIRDLRRFIQSNYTIREIAELPEGTIEYTGIKVYLLDVENTRPGDDDIVIRRYSAEQRKNKRSAVTALKVSNDTFVMLDELEEQGDWNIDRIFTQQDEEYLRFQNSRVRRDLIGNVAQVFRGKVVNKKDPAGSIGVINIANIGEYEINYEELDYIQEEERKVANYILQEGDVLLPARGTAIRTAVFHEQKYPCIASSNIIVIRPDEKLLDSIYLKIFLDSPVGNKVIRGVQQGTTVMNISYKDLNALEVPLPAIDKQKAAAGEYTEELKKYREAVAAADKRWSDVLDRLQKF